MRLSGAEDDDDADNHRYVDLTQEFRRLMRIYPTSPSAEASYSYLVFFTG